MTSFAVGGGEAPEGNWSTVHRLVSRYEKAARRGESPTIEAALAGAGVARLELLIELCHADLEYRLGEGEAARVERYVADYPELAGHPEVIAGLLDTEWTIRRRSEPRLGEEEYRKRYPDLVPRLLALREQHSSGTPTSGPIGHILFPPAVADDPEIPLPAKFKRFELRELIGRGTFGRVYRAWDTRMRQYVAVKLPRQGKAASPTDVETFLREARNASGLRHPNIVQLYEADVHAGTAYLVSEFVEGRTLAERLKAGPLPYATSAELMAIVLEALHYAHEHEKKVIHRDLKPSNILIDQRGRPHLTDFGLAKREGGDSSSTNIHDNHLVGTMAYMSPEQARGDSKKVDPRSDIFSAGIVLYQLLTGELPFRGSGQMLLWQIENYDPLPPRKLHDAIDARLEAICLRALFKNPADRYKSALEMAESLRLYLAGRSVPGTRQVGPVRALVRKALARPVLSLALAYSVLAGVVGVPLLLLALLNATREIAELKQRIPSRRSEASHEEPPPSKKMPSFKESE